jgi:hypothetical protein
MPIVTNDLVNAYLANKAELAKLQEGIARLEVYLTLPTKFGVPTVESPNVDTVVECKDVLTRLQTVKVEAWAAACEAVR